MHGFDIPNAQASLGSDWDCGNCRTRPAQLADVAADACALHLLVLQSKKRAIW